MFKVKNMFRFKFFFLAFVVFHFTKAADEEHVLVGSGTNFPTLLSENNKLVVEFYAPWCGHCKKLAPEYEKAAGQLKAEGIVLAKVDATEEGNKELASKYGVRGFPTLKIFRGGQDKPQEYQGPREADGIVRYLKKQFGPPSVEVGSAEAAKELAGAGLAVFGVFSELSGKAYEAFQGLATANLNDFEFGHTTDRGNIPQCEEAEGKCAKDTVLVARQFDSPVVTYDGDLTDSTALQTFLDAAATPRLVTYSSKPLQQKQFQAAWRNDATAKLLFFADPAASDFEALKEECAGLKGQSDAVTAVYFDFPQYKRQVEGLGATEAMLPLVMIMDPKTQAKWVQPNTKPGSVKAFVDDWQAGKVERYVKSQEVPTGEARYEEDVLVLVANSLEEEVIKSGKDALVEFYAPWCGHCKKLAPTYAKLGAKYRSQPNLLIAKFDATANDVVVDEFDVKGFPTIYFWDGKAKKAVPYSGGRDEDSFDAFLKEHATQLVTEGEGQDDKSEL